MTLRWKIFGLAALLLVIFAAATALSLILYRDISREIEGITNYHLPISRSLSEIDLLTSDYERTTFDLLLAVFRANPERPAQPKQTAEALASMDEAMRREVAQIERLVGLAIADDANDLEDRLTFAEVRGSLAIIRKDLDPYLSIGRHVIAAIEMGEKEEATRQARRFDSFGPTFDNALGDIRRNVYVLTEGSTGESLGQMMQASLATSGLLAFASGFGLLLAGVLSGRLVMALGALIAAARRLETDLTPIGLPVTTRDEVGELTVAFNRMVADLRAKEHIRDTFGKYVDPRVVGALLEGAGEDAADRRVITVFFSDIQGFTSMSEELTAQVMVKFLNQYFTAVTAEIREHHGLVDKYIGDAVMAFWSQPFSTGDNHAADGCLAALAQQRAVEALRGRLSDILGLRRNLPPFRVRMGLATGEAVIGTVGSPTTRSYTAIGDTVNLAARLEGLNKAYGTDILISEDTQRFAQSAVETRELDRVIVAGKSEPIRIFEVIAAAGEATAERMEQAAVYAAGLAAYRERLWDEAEARFADCLKLRPEDGPAAVMLKRLAVFRANPPPENWCGEWRADKN